MSDQPRPTPEELREWFSYDPQTGDVRWAKRNGKRGKVGDIAGSKVQSPAVAQSILEELEHRAKQALAGKEDA